MASSCSNLPCSSVSLPKLPSSTSFPSYFNPFCNGISFQRAGVLHAKFDKFRDQEENLEDRTSQFSSSESQVQLSSEVEEEDDSCLPSDLEGAVRQSGQASATFTSSGGMRAIVVPHWMLVQCKEKSFIPSFHYAHRACGRWVRYVIASAFFCLYLAIFFQVELLIPKLQSLDDEGAQAELWDLSRVFLETLIEETGNQRVKAIYPDAGAAALLKYRWKDAEFGFASLGDRKPVQKEDEIVVMVVPDYQMLEYVQKIASELSNEPPRPLIMWNPRLVSEDVGVGINVRRLRRRFLSTFSVVYSMRPFPSGAVFRCYPGLWKVFYDDKDQPNRYLLAKEYITRPDAEELEIIFGQVEGKSQKGVSLLDQAAGVFSSLNRFMRIISR